MIANALAQWGEEADNCPPIIWQTWTQSNGNKMAFARGHELAHVLQRIKAGPPRDDTPDGDPPNV